MRTPDWNASTGPVEPEAGSVDVPLTRRQTADELGVFCGCKPLGELVEVREGEPPGEGKAVLGLLSKDVGDVAPLEEVEHLFMGLPGVWIALIDQNRQCLAEVPAG
jgi:hypothetical protein